MKYTRVLIISLIIVGVFFAALAGLYLTLRSRAGAETVIKHTFKNIEHNTDSVSAVVPTLLGFDSPRTVLLLFLNNTELRPGGGFIGTYGLVTFDRGLPQNLVTDGTENLDYNAPKNFYVEPPQPIKENLIAKWFFRDSNWSPDFAVSSRKALEFYSAEGGARAADIQTVVGITPEVLSTILKYTGPVAARGTTYTHENITDALEYTVEIEYLHTGTPASQRKEVISDIAQEIIARMQKISPSQWQPLMAELYSLIPQGHVILYDKNPNVQKTIETLGWGGRMRTGTPDKIMVVDANLASLKTDRVIDRSMSYEIFKTADNEWRARIATTYRNAGSFDWRTTRYNTYTRWYLPAGTRLIKGEGSQKSFKNKEAAPWEVTQELGHTVIGSFFVIEPGTTKTVVIEVALAPEVVSAIEAKKYGLFVQKQLGVPEFKLTIHHNFGTRVLSARPPEPTQKFGDNYFDWTGTLNQNAEFTVNL